VTRELKNIYLARRNPALAQEAFAERWRRHGELAMSLPFWRHMTGYLQCDALPHAATQADAYTAAAWSRVHDGVGVVYMSDARALEHVLAHPDHSLLMADELATFAEPVGNFSILATEELHKGRPGTAAKLFAFLCPRAHIDRGEFDRRWSGHVGSVMRSASLAGLVLRYSHNHPIAHEAAGESDANVHTRIDQGLVEVLGVAELGFASLADLDAYVRHPDRGAVIDDLAEFVDLERSLLLATNEVTMETHRPGRRSRR
jgi:hypothetical protein